MDFVGPVFYLEFVACFAARSIACAAMQKCDWMSKLQSWREKPQSISAWCGTPKRSYVSANSLYIFRRCDCITVFLTTPGSSSTFTGIIHSDFRE